MKKRCFCLLLAAVLLMAALPLSPLAAHAVEGSPIQEIEVTVTPPTEGKTTETPLEAVVPEGCGCTVSSTVWLDEDDKDLTSTLTFALGETYHAVIVIDTVEGYYCTQSGGSHVGTAVTVTGGSLTDYSIFNYSDSLGNPHSTVGVYVTVQAQPAPDPMEIARITLGVTPPSAGTGSTDAKSKITVTADGIAETYATWKTFTGYSSDEPTQLDFVEGRTYYGVITLIAAEGYHFKKGEGHSLDIDACDYTFGGKLTIDGAALYNNKANIRSTAEPQYMKIWITVTATAAAKCAVTFDPGTGTGTMEPATVNAGETYELPACTFTHANAARAFYMWDVGGELYEPGVKITVNEDTVVTAVWRDKSPVAIDQSVDKSTSEVLAVLTLTDKRTGETITETVFDETAASSFANPSTPTVTAMIEEAQAALAQKAGEKAGGNALTTLKEETSEPKAGKVADNRTYKSAYLKDEAGDYYQMLTVEGSFSMTWVYTVILEAEYTSPAGVKPGDVDQNGEVETTDARLALRQSINLEHFEPGSPAFVAGDVNKDGNVGTDDARFILRHAIGLSDPEIDW